MMIPIALVVVGKIFELVDDLVGAADELIGLAIVDPLVAEGGCIKESLDVGGQGVALASDIADGGKVIGVGRVVAEDQAVGIAQAVASHRAERRVQLLVDPGEIKEALAAPQ